MTLTLRPSQYLLAIINCQRVTLAMPRQTKAIQPTLFEVASLSDEIRFSYLIYKLISDHFLKILQKTQDYQLNQILTKPMKSAKHELQMEEGSAEYRLMNSSQGEEEGGKDSGEQMYTRSSLMAQDTEDQSKKKAKNATKTFKRLFAYTWKNKALFFVANISLVLSSGGFVLLPLLCGQMVDAIREEGDLLEGTIKFIVLTVVMAICSAIRGYGFNLLGEKIMVEMREQLFSKLLSKDISFYDQNKTGELLSRLGNDITTVYSVCSDNMSILIRNLLQFVGSLLLLWLISWKLTLFILVLTPVISCVVLLVIKQMKKLQKQYSNKMAFTSSLATEVFSNIRVVRSFSNEQLESRNYEGLLTKLYQTGKKKHFYYGAMLLVMTVFANALILIILYFGGQLVIEGQLSIGDLTSFVLYTITLTIGFASISGIINQAISALGICEHIFQIMDEPVKVTSGILKPDLKEDSHPIIQFKKASFCYPSKPTVEVLKAVSFKVSHGESIALVGPSGSGKSSIVSLLLRFYDLNQGSILINGKDIKQVETDKLREQIGFVSQEPTLFSGSLRENVEYGLRESPNREKVIMEALEIANAKEFVFNEALFPEKLDTLVGERGIKLSGGQKQRIAIARCVAKQPKILIFDEATSALDAESEYQVQQAIDKLVGQRDRTVIIVAHRLSTIINCDRILVVREGEIVEEGPHRELLEKKGVYAALVQRQLTSHL